MIKKLNKNRVRRERPLTSFYVDKDTSDYTRIFIQLLDIEFELKELREQVWIHVLRLKFAIANTQSFEIKTQLKFQEKVILEHISDIEKLKKENSKARRLNYQQEYGEDTIFW
tara:strand:- start:311 stop:649 length:339 start_codon:yes stop_codon:yes gene_type:complete